MEVILGGYSMIIYPAIDILDGKCVRLKQGRYEDSTIYHENPAETAYIWQQKGAKWIHLVDLDGAKQKRPVNFEAIKAIREKVDIPLQLGGGLRTEGDIKKVLDIGIDRLILGTVAVMNPFFLYQMVCKYGDKIAVGLDAKDNMVATDGWVETKTQNVFEYAKFVEKLGAKTIIFTDIATDGMLKGPNLKAMKQMREGLNLNLIASGGVSCLQDIIDLKQIGVNGIIVGKALYAKKINLEDISDVC